VVYILPSRDKFPICSFFLVSTLITGLPSTVQLGIEELLVEERLDQNRSRRKGGGRKAVLEKQPVKYENIYMNDYQTVPELRSGLKHYFEFYNQERLHQSLDYQTPSEVHFL
jgi:transposase InsO family protein